MSEKAKILIQIDPDQHPSVFDSIVGIDSGADQLLRFGNVEPLDIRELVHGAMFTRGGDSLRRTAIFIGGSNVQTGEQILRAVTDCFFGPVRVSVMLDANGANTTAVAAVLSMRRHLPLSGQTIAVLAATGAVGQRVCWLLGKLGSRVRVVSRSLERASRVCQSLQKRDANLKLEPIQAQRPMEYSKVLEPCEGLISAGAAGVEILRSEQWQQRESLQVAIDLNAVPPAGVQGIQPTAAGESSESGQVSYGAIGVGNLKMKIHRRCINRLFESNDAVLDVDEIFEIGARLATK